MKRINLKESLLEIDKQTDFKYTLTDLYEACMLEDDDKKKLVQYVEDKDIPAMSAMLSNAAGVMSENVSDDLSDDEVTLVEDDTMSLYRAANLEDIEYIMSYEMPDCIVYDGDVEGEYKCAYHNGVSVNVKFNPDAPGYVYTIDGEGPYETRSSETVKSDITRALDRKGVTEGCSGDQIKESLAKGDELTLWWKDPTWDKHAPCYARVEFIGKDSEGKYKFRSMTYGHVFLVDINTNEIITPQGKVHKLDNSSGWMKIFNQPMNETFKSGDVVFVKPSKKLGRVVSVNGDNVEVEVQGGTDPDRKDTYYKNDLELQDSVEEGWNPDMTDCPSCGDVSFDSKKGRCTRCSYRESWFDDEDEESEYEFVSRKYVTDSDGFQTEYTWYKAPDGLNVFVFGDSDFYRPEDGNFDYEEESDEVAQQWFDSYVGFDDDDNWVIDEGVGAVLGDLAGRAVGDTWQGVKNFAKGVKNTAKDIKTTFNTSDTVAKVKDGVRSLKGAKNVDDLKNEYQRRQQKRKDNKAKKSGITVDTGDPQDWKYVVNGKRMKYDDFMKLSADEREKLNNEKKIKVYDVLGKQKDYSSGLVEKFMTESEDAEGVIFYNFLDARGRSVEDMEEVEVTDDAQAIMAGKSNPQVMTVTKFINGSSKPDEVLWERESDKWYVSRYIGGAEYEPAEGGYYYETLTLDDSLEFATKEEAIEALKEIVAEYEEGELVYQDDVEARFKLGKYIGDCEELYVEREPGIHASGKQVYEALEDHEYARVDGRKLQEEIEQKGVAGENVAPSYFCVQDQLEWTTLSGVAYRAIVTEVTEDFVTLDMMPVDGKPVKKSFELTTDPQGKECIIVDMTKDKTDAVYVYPEDESESINRIGDTSLTESNDCKIKEESISNMKDGEEKIFDLNNGSKFETFTKLHVLKKSDDVYSIWHSNEDGSEIANEIKYSTLNNTLYWINKDTNGGVGMSEALAPDGYSPKKVGKAYKVFRVKNGKLYPPMVANPGGADTPVGVWLTAEEGEFAGVSKTGRPQVKSIGSGTLSYRPGWHLGYIPRASQFDRTNKETGEKEFPKDFVWAECDYVMDVDYQPESDEQGYMRMGKDGEPYRSDKYQHSLAGLPKLPKDGYYKYRTNPRPDTVPWVITGAIKVNKLLSDAEVNSILQSKGIEPIHRQGGDKTLAELGL